MGAGRRGVDPRIRISESHPPLIDGATAGPYSESKLHPPRDKRYDQPGRRSNSAGGLRRPSGRRGSDRLHQGRQQALRSIAGLASAVAAILALLLSFQNPTWGMGLGALVAILLAVFFGYRFAVKTRKFMPAGLLAVVSVVVLAVTVLVLI